VEGRQERAQILERRASRRLDGGQRSAGRFRLAVERAPGRRRPHDDPGHPTGDAVVQLAAQTHPFLDRSHPRPPTQHVAEHARGDQHRDQVGDGADRLDARHADQHRHESDQHGGGGRQPLAGRAHGEHRAERHERSRHRGRRPHRVGQVVGDARGGDHRERSRRRPAPPGHRERAGEDEGGGDGEVAEGAPAAPVAELQQ